MECQYSIMAYGISPDSLPVTSEGILKKGAHVKWVKKHQIRDSAQDGIEKIDVPGKNDVLLGKVGKSMQQHPGNVLLRTFVESKMPEYIRFEARDEKTSYMDNIVVAIRQSSFRFLKLDGQGWWVLATENDVREKISRAFTYAQSNWGKIQKKPEFSTQRAPPEVKRTKLNDEGCFGV